MGPDLQTDKANVDMVGGTECHGSCISNKTDAGMVEVLSVMSPDY